MTYFLKSRLYLWFLLAYAFVIPQLVRALPLSCPPGKLCNPLKPEFSSFPALIEAILKVVVTVGIPIATFFIIYAGFLFVTAAGSEEKIKSAKSTFLWAVVGAVVLLGASLLAEILQNTVNALKK